MRVIETKFNNKKSLCNTSREKEKEKRIGTNNIKNNHSNSNVKAKISYFFKPI